MKEHFMSRQMYQKTLEERHTREVQKKISAAGVAIAGLGGLGSNIAVNLARIGVGRLLLVDFDKVEPSNLNRQQYRMSHIGKKKTDALETLIREINPYVEIKTICIRVTEENIGEIFGKEKIICEAFDAPENKAMLVNALLEQVPDCKIVAASGMAGYGSSNKIITSKAANRLYLCGDGCLDARETNGLMAPRVAICAGHQANMVLRLILGENDV